MKTSWYQRVRTSAFVLIALLGTTPVVNAQQQSPIDIRPENTVQTVLAGLDFQYGSDVALDVVNTGSPGEEATVRANVAAGGGDLTVSGVTYDLLQFHFHAPSEHLLNGHEFPMELHMVHRDALNNLLVVGRWIEVGAFNPTLDPILSNLPQNPGDTLPVASFDLASLLPTSLESFRYPGSLTTSPYTEGVQWVVLAEPLQMSLEQIEAFEALFPEGDSREPQLLHDRVIQTDVSGFATAPEPGSLALLFSIGTPLGIVILRRRK